MRSFPNTANFIALLALTASTSVFAGWQVASKGNESSFPTDPFFQAAGPSGSAFIPTGNTSSASALEPHSALYAISISGSLKENVERIMERYHWKVIWKSNYDYNFDGRVTGASLTSVMEKLFQPFPLQAQLYMSNRTMIVIPRNRNEA